MMVSIGFKQNRQLVETYHLESPDTHSGVSGISGETIMESFQIQ